MKNICKKNQVMITTLAIMIAVAGYLHFAQDKMGEEEYASGGLVQVEDVMNEEGVVVENYTSADFGAEDEMMEFADISDEDIELVEVDSLDMDEVVQTENYLTDSMEEMEQAGIEEQLEDVAVEEAADEVAKVDSEEVPGEAVFTSTNTLSTLSSVKLSKEQTRAKNKEALLEIIHDEALSETQKQSAVDTMVAMTQIAEMETAAEILLEAKGFTDAIVSITGETADVIVGNIELTDASCAQIEDIVRRKTGITAENIIISTNE